MDENKNSNSELGGFETDAITAIPIMEFNNKEIPKIKIFEAVKQGDKPYNKRFYGYRPLFIPNNKDGKFDISYRESRESGIWILEAVITLDSPIFQQRVADSIKELEKDDPKFDINQLSVNTVKARPIYEFLISAFTCYGERFPVEVTEGINSLPYMDSQFTFKVLLKLPKKDIDFIMSNQDKIIIICEYYLQKVQVDTNSLKISVLDYTKSEAFKDIKGNAPGKLIQRSDVRKLMNSLCSTITIEQSLDRPDLATDAIRFIIERFMTRFDSKSDQFAANAQKFYDDEGYSKRDIQPDVVTGELEKSRDYSREKHTLETKNSKESSKSSSDSMGQYLSSSKSKTNKESNERKTEDEQEIDIQREKSWTGEKLAAKELLLVTDVLTAFEQSYDIKFETKINTRKTGYETYPIVFSEFDYTPKKETPQAPPPQAITETVKGVPIEMNLVEGGTFLMGGQDNEVQEDENPAHNVTLNTFYIGKYPVTQAQWRAVMNTNPSHFKGDNLPVEQVSWEDAVEFCHRLSKLTGKTYRLPTEAEWEYAARGGQQSKGYKYAGSNNIDTVAWYDKNSGSTTHPVGQKNPNELGLYDMSGNVWEWCNDWYAADYYKNSPANNPTGPTSGTSRVLRGGSWRSYAQRCRSAYRDNFTPSIRDRNRGFRLVCVP